MGASNGGGQWGGRCQAEGRAEGVDLLTLDDIDTPPRLGERVEFVVGYSDSAVFLHDRLHAVRGGVVEAVWELSARGKIE